MAQRPTSSSLRFPLETCLELYREHVVNCVPEAELASRFAMSPQSVRHEIAGIEAWLAREYRSHLDQMRARHTQRLEAIYCEALAAFQRSRQDIATKRIVEGETRSAESQEESRRKAAVGAPKAKLETTTAGHAGDPKFLTVARDVLSDIRAIWQLEASEGGASSIEQSVADAAWAAEIKRLSDAELSRLRTANRILERFASIHASESGP